MAAGLSADNADSVAALAFGCSHSIPVAHREGRGRLRAWLLGEMVNGLNEEASLLLRPATGPCVMLVWLVAKRRPLVASGCCFRLLHGHYTTWWKICQAFLKGNLRFPEKIFGGLGSGGRLRRRLGAGGG